MSLDSPGKVSSPFAAGILNSACNWLCFLHYIEVRTNSTRTQVFSTEEEKEHALLAEICPSPEDLPTLNIFFRPFPGRCSLIHANFINRSLTKRSRQAKLRIGVPPFLTTALAPNLANFRPSDDRNLSWQSFPGNLPYVFDNGLPTAWQDLLRRRDGFRLAAFLFQIPSGDQTLVHAVGCQIERPR